MQKFERKQYFQERKVNIFTQKILQISIIEQEQDDFYITYITFVSNVVNVCYQYLQKINDNRQNHLLEFYIDRLSKSFGTLFKLTEFQRSSFLFLQLRRTESKSSRKSGKSTQAELIRSALSQNFLGISSNVTIFEQETTVVRHSASSYSSFFTCWSTTWKLSS